MENERIVPKVLDIIPYDSEYCEPHSKIYDDNIRYGLFSCFSDKYTIIAGKPDFISHKFAGTSKYPNYTIDKTKIIELVKINPEVCNVFIAPKRFGKTFTATMICAFYDYYYKNYFDILFQDTYITNSYPNGYGQKSPLCFHSQYYIFSMSFKSFAVLGEEGYEKSLYLLLLHYFSDFSQKYFGKDLVDIFLSRNLSKHDSYKRKIIYFFNEMIDFCNSIIDIDSKNGIQLLIFIDECQDAYCSFQLNDSDLKLFGGFIASITKDFKTFHRKKPILFMVGLLPLPSSIMNSNLESIQTHYITSPIMTYFIGFFSKDVEKMFKDFNLSNEGKDLLRQYFNSYTFCDFDYLSSVTFIPKNEQENNYSLYNPWSLMKSLEQGQLSLLFTSGQTPFVTINNAISKQNREFSEILFRLINEHRIIHSQKPKFELNELINPTNNTMFMGLLLNSGYLSYKEGQVYIPDKEIHKYFIEKFSELISFDKVPINITNSLEQYFNDRHFFEFFSCIQENISEIFPPDNDYNERFYQYRLCMWFMNSLPNLTVKADYPIEHYDKSRPTFVDLLLMSNDGVAIVIEIKLGGDTSDSFLSEAFKGYNQIYNSRYIDIRRHVKVDLLLVSSISVHGNDSCFVFTDLEPKEVFSSSKIFDLYHYTIPPLSRSSRASKKAKWIDIDKQSIEDIISEYIGISSILFVENILDIQGIKSLENWTKITGFLIQDSRDHQILNNEISSKIMTFVALRGVYIQPVKACFVLNPPKDKRILSSISAITEDQIILLHKNYDQQIMKEITEILNSLN